MKAFMKWLALTFVIFGGFSAGYHFYLKSNPRRVLVILDTSFPMGQVWDKVPGILATVENRKYSKYALASEKGLIHGWSDGLKPGRTVPYAPRNIDDLDKKLAIEEIKAASEIYLITNADPAQIHLAKEWKLIRM